MANTNVANEVGGDAGEFVGRLLLNFTYETRVFMRFSMQKRGLEVILISNNPGKYEFVVGRFPPFTVFFFFFFF
jgi:hypothetical protein